MKRSMVIMTHYYQIIWGVIRLDLINMMGIFLR